MCILTLANTEFTNIPLHVWLGVIMYTRNLDWYIFHSNMSPTVSVQPTSRNSSPGGWNGSVLEKAYDLLWSVFLIIFSISRLISQLPYRWCQKFVSLIFIFYYYEFDSKTDSDKLQWPELYCQSGLTRFAIASCLHLTQWSMVVSRNFVRQRQFSFCEARQTTYDNIATPTLLRYFKEYMYLKQYIPEGLSKDCWRVSPWGFIPLVMDKTWLGWIISYTSVRTLWGDKVILDNILPGCVLQFATSPPHVLMHLMIVAQIVVVNSSLVFDDLASAPTHDIFLSGKLSWWHQKATAYYGQGKRSCFLI